MATIAEVARYAGVGVATVSRVLNGSPAVREQDAAARARGDRRSRLRAQRRRPCPVDRPHPLGRRHRPVLHAALGDGAPARRLARARERRLPARAVRRGAAGPGFGRSSARCRPGSTACCRSRCARHPRTSARFAAAGMPVVLVDYHAREPSISAHRRRRRRAAGHRAPARARPPADRLRRRRRAQLPRVHLERPAARRLRAGARPRPGSRWHPTLVRRAAHGREPARGPRRASC